MQIAHDLDFIQARIEERLHRANTGRADPLVRMPPSAITHLLAIHLSMVRQWGQAISLTSLRDLDEAIDRHVVESVVASELVATTEGRALDVGSGNGYPALPIKCLKPGLKMTLLEPNLRKSVFLKRVAVAVGHPDVEVVRERIDQPSDVSPRAPLDLITMRGVDRAEAVVEGGFEALTQGGRILLFVGKSAAQRIRSQLPRSLNALDLPTTIGLSFGILVLEKRS